MSDSQERARADDISPAYANYVLGLLFVAYVFNFVDRQILGILLESIKQDLQLSDKVMGLLTGTMFAVFYATLGIPIARLADVWVRRSIIALGLALWSGMTAASGMAQSLLQLAGARIGVGVGEAALSPPAHSLISDYFPPEKRATALGIYAVGIHVGTLFGFKLGGMLDDAFGWRMAFMIVGVPGLLLALLVRFTVREPKRGRTDPAPASRAPAPPVSAVLAHLVRQPSFVLLSIAMGMMAFAGYAFSVWAPTFLRRVHGWSSSEAGDLGWPIGIGGALGSILAGWLADRLGRRDARWWMWVPALAGVVPLPFTLGFLFAGDPLAALWLSTPGLAIAAFYQGPTFAAVQNLAPPPMRAVASGIMLFITTMIGYALGPLAIGWLNDTVFAHHGELSVRYSLAAVLSGAGVLGSLFYVLAARTLRTDLHRAAARA
jgi:predicted MFS family arabinose efflux permease